MNQADEPILSFPEFIFIFRKSFLFLDTKQNRALPGLLEVGSLVSQSIYLTMLYMYHFKLEINRLGFISISKYVIII